MLEHGTLFHRLLSFTESGTTADARAQSPLLLLSAALALLAEANPPASAVVTLIKGGETLKNLALLWSVAFGLDDSIWSAALDRSALDPVSDLLASPEFKKTVTYQLCRVAREEVIADRLSDAFIPFSDHALFTKDAFDIFATNASTELRTHSPGAVSSIIERCVHFSRK